MPLATGVDPTDYLSVNRGARAHEHADRRAVMESLRYLSLLIAFVLELAVLTATGYAGFALVHPIGLRVLVGLGVPVLMAVAWGLFAAPKASMPLHGAASVTFQVAWFGAGALALALAGRTAPAIAIAVVYLLNSAALRLLER
ncbi:MAG TPA: YrdB family protein [Cellulomonadaceae bacterium]|nr:YrdB family protein [Cellulomonadaceae bacterium]